MRSKAALTGTANPAATTLAEPGIERDIALVLAFLNTTDAESGSDALDDPARWTAWCSDHGLTAPADTKSVREVRDILRNSVNHGDHGGDGDAISAVASPWPLHVIIRNGVPVLTAADAVGAVLAAAVHLVATEHWDRVKICPADDCLWAFYDRSRNRSRTWCSMSVCGNREKARSWRERHPN